jgi:hypothetical protein
MRRQGRSGARRCMVPECARFVRPGQAVCPVHRGTAAGREAQVAARRMAAVDEAEGGGRKAEGDDERAGERFRRRLERGDYRGLLDERVREVMAQAEERGLGEEIGALRFVLMRVLAEEEGPRGYPGAVVVGGQPVGDGGGAVGASEAGAGPGVRAAERGDLADLAGSGRGAGRIAVRGN